MLARQVSVPNRLLAALPRKDYRKLLRCLEPVKLAFGTTLYESHSQIQQVYFPNDCFVSMLTTVDADRAAEVGLIGSEGMIGVPMALGVAVSPFRAVVRALRRFPTACSRHCATWKCRRAAGVTSARSTPST